MSVADEIGALLKGRIIIRHRTEEEQAGSAAVCSICSREMVLPAGAVCMVIEGDGLLCGVCANRFAPEMASLMNTMMPVLSNSVQQEENPRVCEEQVESTALSSIQSDIEKLIEVTDVLSKGVARGIVEAPTGHISLMHYAKNIYKPQQRTDETDSDYKLRVKTYRMTRLYENIREDTTRRVERIQEFCNHLRCP